MALTFSTLIDKGERTYPQQHGAVVKVADVTIGTVSADYSSGIDISGNAAKLGLQKVLSVIQPSVRASSGTLKPMQAIYDYATGKVRFYLQGSATTVAPVEITATTHLADGDIVRLTIIGV